MDRFMGLELVNKVPEELWTEVHNIVHEAAKKKHNKEKKCKKAEWLSEEALQIVEERGQAAREKEKGTFN